MLLNILTKHKGRKKYGIRKECYLAVSFLAKAGEKAKTPFFGYYSYIFTDESCMLGYVDRRMSVYQLFWWLI